MTRAALALAGAAAGLAVLTAMFLNSLVHDILYTAETMYAFGFALAVAAALARSGRDGPEASPS